MMDLLGTLKEEISRKRKGINEAVGGDKPSKLVRKVDLGVKEEVLAPPPERPAGIVDHQPPPSIADTNAPTAVDVGVSEAVAVDGNVDGVGHNGEEGEMVAKKVSKDDQLLSLIEQHRKDFVLISFSTLKSDRDYCFTLIYLFLKDRLFLWECTLAERAQTSTTAEAKLEARVYSEATRDIKPLLKKLKKKDLAEDIEEKIAEIIHWVYRREYVKANDAYLRLAIGNAAWPLGVAAVGIHERKAREKITTGSEGAHALKDETQRKYIQALKRIITFSQKMFPPDDITKSIG